MSTALVIVAGASGPQHDSVLAAAGAAAAGLHASGLEVTVLDLDDFDPVMSPAERAAYVTDTPILDDTVRRHAELVGACRVLVVVYGSVMGTVPATMKGWLDRVLVPGVAFTMSPSGRTKRGLTHIDRIVGIAVHDREHAGRRRARWIRSDAGRRIIARNVRLCARLTTRVRWVAVDPGPTGQQRTHVRSRITAAVTP